MAQWFRFYADAFQNPKVGGLSDKDLRTWIELLCFACRNDGKLADVGSLATLQRVRKDHLKGGLDRLIKAGLIDMIDGVPQIHNWEERQFKSDTSNERVRKHRGKCNVTETLRVTAPETETETETDNRPDRPVPRPAEIELVGSVVSKEFFKAIKAAIGDDPVRLDHDIGAIEAVMVDGATEADVLTGIARAKEATAAPIRRWHFFGGWIRGVMDDRRAKRPPPAVRGPQVELKPGLSVPVSEIRQAVRDGRWYPRTWGPKPSETGCWVPKWVFEQQSEPVA